MVLNSLHCAVVPLRNLHSLTAHCSLTHLSGYSFLLSDHSESVTCKLAGFCRSDFILQILSTKLLNSECIK